MRIRFLITCITIASLSSGLIKSSYADDDITVCNNNSNANASDNVFKSCFEAAKLGNPLSQLKYGVMLFRKKDYINSEIWLKKSAEQGNNDAQYALGEALFYGDEFTKDYTESRYWLAKAANAGNIDAQYLLGVLLYSDGPAIKDYDEAYKWFDKAAKQNHLEAQVYLGLMYENGYGVVKNKHEAFKYYLKSALQGEPSAQFNLSKMYSIGESSDLDILRKTKWLLLAARINNKYKTEYNSLLTNFNEDVAQQTKKTADSFRKNPVVTDDAQSKKWITDYRSNFKAAKTSEDFEVFIVSYEYDDPDKLVPKAIIKYNQLLAKRGLEALRKAESDKRKCNEQLATWRHSLKIGDQTNLGMVIEIKKPILKVQTFLGERWFNINQLYPPTIQ